MQFMQKPVDRVIFSMKTVFNSGPIFIKFNKYENVQYIECTIYNIQKQADALSLLAIKIEK